MKQRAEPFEHIYDSSIDGWQQIDDHLETCDGLLLGDTDADARVTVLPGNGADAGDYMKMVSEIFSYAERSVEMERKDLCVAVYDPEDHYSDLGKETARVSDFLDCLEDETSSEFNSMVTHSASAPLGANVMDYRKDWEEWDRFVALAGAFGGTPAADAALEMDKLHELYCGKTAIEWMEKFCPLTRLNPLTRAYRHAVEEMGLSEKVPEFTTVESSLRNRRPEVLQRLERNVESYTLTGGRDEYYMEDPAEALSQLLERHYPAARPPDPVVSSLSRMLDLDGGGKSDVLAAESNIEFPELGHTDLAVREKALSRVAEAATPGEVDFNPREASSSGRPQGRSHPA